MSFFGLSIFTLLILAIYGNEIVPNKTCGGGHVLSENDGDIKITSSNNDSDKRTVNRPLFTSSTSSPMVFKPTPTQHSESTTQAHLEELLSTTLPNAVELPPPAATNETLESVTICGKMGNCYQWFNDVWALELSGYKRCQAGDERRAKRYCCIPPKLAL